MDHRWKIIYYETLEGKSLVFEFIQNLDPKAKSKVINAIDLLAESGIMLGLPHAKKLTGTQLWELRTLGQDNIRIFYIAVIDKSFLLLHGFQKKKQKTDQKEIRTAEKRLEEYKQSFSSSKSRII